MRYWDLIGLLVIGTVIVLPLAISIDIILSEVSIEPMDWRAWKGESRHIER